MLLLAGALAEQGKGTGDDLTAHALAVAPDSADVVRGAARVALLKFRTLNLSDSDRRRTATEARDLYARAVSLAPDVPAAHAGLGFAHYALNQPMEASTSLQQAFLMERWNLDVVLALGELHARYGRPEDARRLLREVAGSAHDAEMRARAKELLDQIDTSPRALK